MGTLAPLLTVTVVACTFFYDISNKIIEYYLNAELSRQVERVNSNVLERMNPVMVNIEDFANFAELTDDDTIMQPLVVTFMKNLPYASGFYYTSKTSTLNGGLFVHSGGWVPPRNWDQTTREWYKLAIHNPNQLCFTSPFTDADSGELAITISKSVYDMQGNIKGVVACDILLSRLVTLFQEIQISKNGHINMIDKNGYYMTHENTAKIMKDNYFNETTYKGNMSEWLNLGQSYLKKPKTL